MRGTNNWLQESEGKEELKSHIARELLQDNLENGTAYFDFTGFHLASSFGIPGTRGDIGGTCGEGKWEQLVGEGERGGLAGQGKGDRLRVELESVGQSK